MFLFLTIVLPFSFSGTLAAQTCSAPLTLSVNDCNTYSVSDTTIWFAFNSGSGASTCDITISVPIGDPGSLVAAELYGGTCASLTMVQTGIADINSIVIRSNISASTSYLIKVTRSISSSGQLDVCSSIHTNAAAPCAPCTTGCNLVCNSALESIQGTIFYQPPANFVSTNVCYWGTAGAGTPDYFNTNFLNSAMDGTNFAGNETPHSQDGYGGIYCYYTFAGHYREYIQHQLQAPLVAGRWYTLTFWVSLSDYSGYAVNHLGAYFSSSQPVQATTNVMILTPQVFSTTAITTTNGWVPITGNYQATGGEQWITIGSFEDNFVQQHPAMVPPPSATNPFSSPSTDPNRGAYYYIDDITLEVADPCFNWSTQCGVVSFYHNSPCDHLILSESWDFDDPASGPNNTSTSSTPSHSFTHSNLPYNVVHTIYTANEILTCTVTVIQEPKPVANIVGYATNNCGSGTITYSAVPCDPNLQYTWTTANGSVLSPSTGCSITADWLAAGDILYLTVWDPVTDCFGYDTLVIPECCHGIGTIRLDNTTASQAIAQYGNPITSASNIFITGVFTVDVPIVFQNCPNIQMGGNTPILVNASQTITFDKCTTNVLCDFMWDGIYASDPSASIVIKNGSMIQYAKNAVVSNNGGHYDIQNSTLNNNYKDVVVNGYFATHSGIIRNTDFTMTGSFLTAVPAFPFGHNITVVGIEINDNANIKIGDGSQISYRNRFSKIACGIRSEGSSTTVENASFFNMQPTFQQQFTIPNAGTGIVSIGGRSFLFPLSLKVGGGSGTQFCSFNELRVAVDCFENHTIDVNSNTMTKLRVSGVRVSRDRSSVINVNNNSIVNIGAPFGFQTAIQMLECYQSTIWITSNTIRQATGVPNQIGTGIRVGLVTPGDVILNVVGNTIDRTRTGIWIERLIGKDHVYITQNTINFQKNNNQYTTLHEGVRVFNCGGNVRVKYNIISKSNPSPANIATPNNLRGVSVISSPATIVGFNTLTRLGAGVYAENQCGGSSFVCNSFVTCVNGFFFQTANIGDQLLHPQSGIPTPTGNTWSGSINFDITGSLTTTIHWYHDASPPPSIALPAFSLFGAGNTVEFSGNPSGCSIPQFVAPGPSPVKDREQNAGEPVVNPGAFIIGTEQRYSGRAHAHRMLKTNQTWLTLGSPQDTLYSEMYLEAENSNIGLFRNFEDMAAIDSVQAAGNILSTIVDTNTSETNLSVVYSIYELTWMQGVFEFSSADSATLMNIAVQSSNDAGEGVFAARVMLGLIIDDANPSSARYGSEPEAEEQVSQSFALFPNPANSSVNGTLELNEGQTAIITVIDLQGKIVQSLNVTTSGLFTLDISQVENGLYFVQVIIDGELIENNKLEIIHD